MKNILLLLSSAVFIFLACQPADQSQPEKAEPENPCVTRVMQLDDSLGTIRNHTCEKRSLSYAIRVYTVEISKIEMAECPESFRAALKKHRNAWRDLLPVTDKYPDLRGEMHILFDSLKVGPDAAAFNPLIDAVWSTWDEVESAAGRKS